MIKVSDYIYNFIADQGVKHVFVLPGGGCMHLVDSLGRNKQMSYVSCLHEQGASIAAGAYAQYTNNLGSALVTTGPGSTNAITGVAGAWTESIPLLIISGQVKRADIAGFDGPRTLGFQEIGIVTIVQSITKYAVTVLQPEDIRYHLEQAVYMARSGRPGPVWLDIPLDVQASLVDENDLRSFNPSNNEMQVSADVKDLVKSVVEMINQAERPVILAGYGIKLSDVQKEFFQLIEQLQIPVLTTWKAIDLLPDGHPLFCGRPGSVGQRGANFIQQNSDLFISIGARLDFGQIAYSYENFARGAKKVIVDIDAAELKKLKFDNQLTIKASAGDFIKEMLKQSQKIVKRDNGVWLTKCKEWKNKYPVVLSEYKQQTKFVSTYALVDLLSEELSGEDLLVPGSSGACSDVFMQAFRVKAGQRILNMPGIGSMGFGLPSSIGACVASGRKRTICVNGDGGFQLNIQELATVAHLKLPIKYFILNNGGYGSIKATQRNYFQGFYVSTEINSGLFLPDICKLAEVYGITAVKVSNYSELEKNIKNILTIPGPVICEVLVEPNEMVQPKLTSMVRPDGSIISKPMEDLAPFLDRQEFKDNMVVPPPEE